jgi:signal transduction histidine kinase
MGTDPQRRLLWLFLAIVLLPCIALLAISLRIASQERELSERRRLESRQQAVQQVTHQLLSRLERLKHSEALLLEASPEIGRAYSDPATVFVTRVVHDRMLLPWENDPSASLARRQLGAPSFAQLIRQGERLEAAGSFAAAGRTYARAATQGEHALQNHYGRLLYARALQKEGRVSEALTEYRAVLGSGSDLRDEYGVPLAFYAAESLISAYEEEVLARLAADANDSRTLAPAAFYMLLDLLSQAGQRGASTTLPLDAALDEQHAQLERVLALAADFPELRAAWASGGRHATEPLWLLWGEPSWLLSVGRMESGEPFLIAVDGPLLFGEIEAAAAGWRFAIQKGASGEPLGGSLPGLTLVFHSARDEELSSVALQRSLYWLVILLVVMVALFGTYLLLHGVRRELRLAELRTQFVSSVSHELKTPLTAIRMFAESLRLGRPADPVAKGEYLDTIINESERLTRLLNNVLDFSKLERGTTQYQRASVPLQDILAAAARAVQYPLAQQGFELKTEIDDSVQTVHADADAIQQAVLNLLSNAMKYSGSSRSIQMNLRAEKGDAIIEVRDGGVGIPLKEQRRIFEKFYRVSSPLVQQTPGTGLGLTLVEHVAAAHGGRVEVESAPGLGSTFRLRVPLEAPG